MEGKFTSEMPIGKCDITFTEQNVTCSTEFKNGKRAGLATYTYENGLVVQCKVDETYPALCKSIIPYTRNYYNPSALSFGGNRFEIKTISWYKDELNEDQLVALRWLLKHFDVAQHHIRMDLTEVLIKALPKEYNFWVSSEEFSRLEHVTLCDQMAIKRNRLNYMLPSIPKLSDLNTFLSRSPGLLSESPMDKDKKLFTENASLIFLILQRSPFLRLVQFIAVPHSIIIFGDRKEEDEVGGFCFKLSELKQLSDVIVESSFSCFGLAIECFLVREIHINERLQIKRLILKGSIASL